MWASLCSFLYDKLFSKQEINSPPLSQNQCNNCSYGKRLKLSTSVNDRKDIFVTSSSYSMQGKENFLVDIKDDDECCIIAEVKRKTPGGFSRTRSDNFFCNKLEAKSIDLDFAASVQINPHLEEKNKDIEIVKCIKNVSLTDQSDKFNNKNYKFFTTPRSYLSQSKAAKSKLAEKMFLKKKLNRLQETYRLTEKLQYIQLLQSLTSSNLMKSKLTKNISSLPKDIPLVDLTEEKNIFTIRESIRNYSMSSTSSESNNKSDDSEMIIIKKIPTVNLCENVLKTNPVNVIKEIFLKEPERIVTQPFVSQPDCDADAVALLEEVDCKKTSPEDLEVKLQTLMHITKSQIEECETEKKEFLLPEISIAQEKKIQAALVREPKEEVLATGFGLDITRSDMYTLKGLNWLNDEIINFYMNLIMERSKQNQLLPKVYSFNTFFYPQLVSKGYSKVRRWTKKVNIFSFDMVFVPIHLGMHWCLSVIDLRIKSIKYYDSIGSLNDSCLEHLLSYLEAESMDKLNKPLQKNLWTKKNVENIPQQMNGSDCGVFSCMFAEHLARDSPISFTQDHMAYFRRKMVLEILEGKLLT